MANDNYQPNMRQAASISQMGAVVRAPYWPTLPQQSASRETISQVRFYSVGLAPADTDNILNAPATREVRFNLPGILLHAAGACTTSDGSGLPAGWAGNDCYEIELTFGSGSERITISSRLASTVVGTAERPGFMGGGGWICGQGAVLQVVVTPRLPGLAGGVNTKIDVTFAVMEFRTGSSFNILGG